MSMGFYATFTLFAFAIAVPGVRSRCETSADCSNNFDCIRLGFFLGSTCAPKSCAVGAVQSMIDEGFDPQKWVEHITAKSGTSGKNFWGGTSNKDAETLRRAYESADPPPIDAFTRYFDACINPKSDAGRAQPLTSTLVYNGVQWSAGAGFLYTGKSFWAPYGTGTAQIVNHCVGFLLGAQIGAASYVAQFRTWNMDIDDPSSWISDPFPPYYCRQESLCVPIVTLGLLQVSICWNLHRTIESYCIVEVSVGAQFGAGLGGYQSCTSETTYPDKDYETNPPTDIYFDNYPFGAECSTAATVDFDDTVVASLALYGKRGRPFLSADCGDVVGVVAPYLYTTSLGYWYRITGDGKEITIDTCFEETNFDAQITVWTNCLDLSCVAGNDDFGPTLPCMPNDYTCSCAKVSWESTVDVEYVFFVHRRVPHDEYYNDTFSVEGNFFKMTITSA